MLLFLLNPPANGFRSGGVESRVTFLDMLDFSLRIHHERGAVRDSAIGNEHSIRCGGFAHKIAEERVGGV